MALVRTLALHLLRRGWRATVFLALLAGLSAGVAMAACAAGRRTATVFDRFIEFADPPHLVVTFCPPDLVEIDPDELVRCFSYDAVAEMEVLRSLPEVDAAGRAMFSGMLATSTSGPPRRWLANGTLVRDGGFRSLEGEHLLLSGRWFSPEAADEVVVNERFVQQAHVDLGEELELTFWSADEIGSIPGDDGSFSGPTVRVRVVGVVRGLLDLAAASGASFFGLDEARALAGPGLGPATIDAGGYGGVVIRARDGDADAVGLAVQRAFPDRMFNISPALSDEIEPIREAIDYEARGAWLFGIIAAVAAAVFVTQAVARQSRREWSALPTLRAIGVEDADVRKAAWLRGAATGAVAAAIAAITAFALSRFGPVGEGRRAEVDPGLSFDGVVIVPGTIATLVLVAVATVVPVHRRRRSRATVSSHWSRLGSPRRLPIEAVAGLGMTSPGHRDGRAIPLGTAVIGVGVAVAAVVAAASMTMSLDVLTNTPAHYGALWDLSIANVRGATADIAQDLAPVLAEQPEIEAVAGIVGTDIAIGDEVIWVQAHQSIGAFALVPPVITAGREPRAVDEIALGTITMRDLGLDLGDTVEVQATVTGTAPMTMTVVGTAVVNDTYEVSPGRGGIVTVDWLGSNAPETSADPVVVRLARGADALAVAGAIEERLPVVVSPPQPHGAIRNIERIAGLPFLLATVIATLAVASLAHALASSIRRSRRELAVWKSMGFTRRQVRAAVAWHATTLVVVAAVVGAPLGVILGVVGWNAAADQIGVPTNPSMPLLGVVTSIAGAILVANLIAAYPGWREARQPTALALRAE